MLVVRGPEENIEVRGANLYPLPRGENYFAVIPIFPPVFSTGSLRYLDRGVEVQWFISASRTMYISNGIIVEGEQRRTTKDSRFLPALEKCIKFMDALEQQHKVTNNLDSLVDTMIYIDDVDAEGLPQWLVSASFLEQWAEYKDAAKTLENINTYTI